MELLIHLGGLMFQIKWVHSLYAHKCRILVQNLMFGYFFLKNYHTWFCLFVGESSKTVCWRQREHTGANKTKQPLLFYFDAFSFMLCHLGKDDIYNHDTSNYVLVSYFVLHNHIWLLVLFSQIHFKELTSPVQLKSAGNIQLWQIGWKIPQVACYDPIIL